MFVELHILQNFAPSCLNRDDTNSPKDCEFGGYRRARISSQCIKRAVRSHPTFIQFTPRSRWQKKELADHISAFGFDKEILDPVTKFLKTLTESVSGGANSSSTENEDGDTKTVMWLSGEDMHSVCDYVSTNLDKVKNAGKKEEKKKLVTEFAKGRKGLKLPVDIGLFGRMLANAPLINVDAAVQVSHAISTHKVSMEMDFYTAVDDLKDREAGMMGTIEFNSACFYRYSLVDYKQLLKNLQDDCELAKEAVCSYLKASALAIPTGKQNSMAAQNPPSFVMAVVRESGAPWSLANAFEKPVQPNREQGLVEKSISSLDAYWGQLAGMYGDEGIRCIGLCQLDSVVLENLSQYQKDNLQEILEMVEGGLQ